MNKQSVLSFTVFILTTTQFISSCAPKAIEQANRSSNKSKNVSEAIVMELTSDQKMMAKTLGVSIEGDAILTLRGSKESLEKLDLKNTLSTEDVIIEAPAGQAIDAKNYYLAKEDFGIPEFLDKYPNYDGRGVVVGGIDDGVAPSLPGLKLTSDGKRKFLNRTSSSDLYKIETTLVGESGTINNDASDFIKTYSDSFEKAYEVVLDIENIEDLNKEKVDYNGDEKHTDIHVGIFVSSDSKSINACFDINVDKKISNDECLRPFSSSGDYIFWDKKVLRELTFEFSEETRVLKFSEGEVSGDSHGEGVASVMTGHLIGGKFNGVAPGAQYLDYDLSQRSNKFSLNSVYTVGTFLRALEWMGQNKAEVVNISYSLFFINAKSQEFMKKALEKIVEKYNMVISFSAGNNGPGLGSHNRGAIYPTDSLVAGAYLNRDLDEAVHGVTGLPEQGQVVYYSSIGPGVHDGAGPTVISPLSSLTYSSGVDGFRSFSGTSSASPALAGAAAVLISAAKQEGLEIDAGSIVHSLRQSATMLEGVPFVVQGRGLPKLPKALEVYKEMIKGKLFKDISISIVGKGDDDINRKGLFYNLSEASGEKEEVIHFKGAMSKLAPVESRLELLETVDIEYSHDFIKGASQLWIASGRSRLFINIDLDLAKKLNRNEIFSEIKIISKKTKEVLQIVPITLINDFVLDKPTTVSASLSAQSGHRKHLNLPSGIKGVAVRFNSSSELLPYLRAIFYDSSRKKTTTLSGLKPNVTYFIKATNPGSAQFTLARFGGSSKNIQVSYELSPINITVPDPYIAQGDKLRVINHSLPLGIRYSLEKISAPLSQKRSNMSIQEPLNISSDIKVAGSYNLKTKMTFEGVTTYPWLNCVSTIKTKDAKIKRSFSKSVYLAESEVPAELSFKCYPFDTTDEEVFSKTTVFAQITKDETSYIKESAYLEKGANTLDFSNMLVPEVETGARYKLIIKPLTDDFAGGSSDSIVITEELLGF